MLWYDEIEKSSYVNFVRIKKWKKNLDARVNCAIKLINPIILIILILTKGI